MPTNLLGKRFLNKKNIFWYSILEQMSHYHPDGLYGKITKSLAQQIIAKRSDPTAESLSIGQTQESVFRPPKSTGIKGRPHLKAAVEEKAAKYPIAQRAFLANRRPSQQALPDLSITQQEEPEELDQTPVSTPPPVLVRQVRRAPTPPKRPVGTKPVAKK